VPCPISRSKSFASKAFPRLAGTAPEHGIGVSRAASTARRPRRTAWTGSRSPASARAPDSRGCRGHGRYVCAYLGASGIAAIMMVVDRHACCGFVRSKLLRPLGNLALCGLWICCGYAADNSVGEAKVRSQKPIAVADVGRAREEFEEDPQGGKGDRCILLWVVSEIDFEAEQYLTWLSQRRGAAHSFRQDRQLK
jgi:hypothetical protein